MPAATPPVAIGAPPVETEDEGDDFLVPEVVVPEAPEPPEPPEPPFPVVVAAAVLIVEEAVLCAGAPVAGVLEDAAPTGAEVGSAPIKWLIMPPSDEAQALTL